MTKDELEHIKKSAHILDREQGRHCYNDDEAEVFDYASDVLIAAIRTASLQVESVSRDTSWWQEFKQSLKLKITLLRM